MSSDTREVVLGAFEAFRTALRTKDWEPFLDCFTDDIEFWEPVPGEFNGRNVGKAKLREFYTSQGDRLDLKTEDPLSLVVEGEQAVIEYAESGTLDGAPFSNRVAMSYAVRDGRIAMSREYLGDMAV